MPQNVLDSFSASPNNDNRRITAELLIDLIVVICIKGNALNITVIESSRRSTKLDVIQLILLCSRYTKLASTTPWFPATLRRLRKMYKIL